MPLDNGTLNILYHKQEEFVSTFAFRETLKKMSLVARGGGVCVCVCVCENIKRLTLKVQGVLL